MKHSRHALFRQRLAGVLLLGVSTIVRAALPDSVKPKTPKAVSSFHPGVAGYTLVNFGLDTTLKTLERLDIHYLCIKDFHLSLNSANEQIRTSHGKYAVHRVTGYAVGPIYMKSEEEIGCMFDYAKWVRMKLIVGVPSYELLPYIDKKVKEYDSHYATHLYGLGIRTYPDAMDTWGYTKDLNPRIGMRLDVGHDLRSGCNPITGLKKYHTRVFDIHIKGMADSPKVGVRIEIGRGKIDFPALIRMIREVNYTGMCSLEYEKDIKGPLLGIAEFIGYFEAVSDST